MFQLTRVRLTIQNSFILIIVICAISIAVFTYLRVLLYSDLDDELEDLMVEYEILVEKGFIPLETSVSKPTFLQDPRVWAVLWDESGEIIQTEGQEALFLNNQDSFRPGRDHKVEQKGAEGYYFRTIASHFETEYGTLTVQLLRNVNSEQDMLQRVGALLTLGTIAGGIIFIVVGFYLAGKTLGPIREAMDKQQQFVSDASHELRTPLSVIQSRAELLLRSPQDTIEDRAVEVSVIAKECRRLTKLVGDLLLLTRTDSTAVSIKKERFQITGLLEEIVGNYKEIAALDGKQVTLKAGNPVEMYGDSERIHQLAVILLDNAIKFTEPETGKITVICRQLGNQIELSVADNGIGIQKKDIPHIFDRFYQGEKSRSGNEGTGLGLSIAKWIIDQHQAKVKVNSEEGMGTTIQVLFPGTRKKEEEKQL